MILCRTNLKLNSATRDTSHYIIGSYIYQRVRSDGDLVYRDLMTQQQVQH